MVSLPCAGVHGALGWTPMVPPYACVHGGGRRPLRLVLHTLLCTVPRIALHCACCAARQLACRAVLRCAMWCCAAPCRALRCFVQQRTMCSGAFGTTLPCALSLPNMHCAALHSMCCAAQHGTMCAVLHCAVRVVPHRAARRCDVGGVVGGSGYGGAAQGGGGYI